jgi:hypothetical protein
MEGSPIKKPKSISNLQTHVLVQSVNLFSFQEREQIMNAFYEANQNDLLEWVKAQLKKHTLEKYHDYIDTLYSIESMNSIDTSTGWYYTHIAILSFRGGRVFIQNILFDEITLDWKRDPSIYNDIVTKPEFINVLETEITNEQDWVEELIQYIRAHSHPSNIGSKCKHCDNKK